MKKPLFVFIPLLIFGFLLSSCKKETNLDERDRGLIEAYVLDNNLDGEYTSSGLYYVIENPGASIHPTIYSKVNVSYTGYTLDNVVFDDGEYITFDLNRLILGWQEGIQLIGEGGSIKLVIPSAIAYGSQGSGSIGSNEVLVFDISLNYFNN